ncbi:dicarboxylate/amino acid:cation symporter [Sporomusa acidovorans]|uniref:C4-dicarboxylate transport protein n=1 Tax=Sporomusa acidovorans (strain ATCC 49682 / DSM 3132 / Mol) TaxID=1123286 RepID=A0ABZ3IVY2_SPOA4|nr:dicarboxylate/amino acid:cation symporter [Sporomusa acidovorans]OZC13977.1 C4-dicarboxylate transport protein [Sporomusa acidovorans DSM 3132]SDF21614.1 Na+/H+-dicarboxylate symporter [Sporomusa acidovorans]
MFSWYTKMKLTNKIFLAMLIGSLLGIVAGPLATQLEWIGNIWLNLIKMMVIPLVIFTMVQGIASMDNPKTLGRIWLRATLYYLVTTIIAVLIGIVTTTILKPGLGFVFEKGAKVADVPKLVDLKGFMVSLFSDNIFVSFTKGDIVQVLIVAIIIGIAIVKMPAEKSGPVKAWFSSMNNVVMAVIGLIMDLAPIGVFCLMAAALGKYGIGFLGTMSKLIGTYYLAAIIQLFGVYLLTVWIFTRMTPFDFMRRTSNTWIFTLSTCSSAAAIPISLQVAKEELAVSKDVADFIVPYGTQMNHDGNAILIGTVLIFCAQAIGIDFSIAHLVQMVLLGVILSAGGGGIPSSGIVKLMIVAQAFSMPLEIIVMVGAFYRLFDMAVTTMNCLGDLAGTIIVDKMEKV